MRRLMAALALVAALGLMLMPVAAHAAVLRYSSGTNGLSVTSSSASTAFTDNASTVAIHVTWVWIRNRSTSANTCQYQLSESASSTATTANGTPLEVGASVVEPYRGSGPGYRSIAYICATGTATFSVEAGS
jgi:hypothetical protein